MWRARAVAGRSVARLALGGVPTAHRPAATLPSPHLRACVAMTGAAKPRWLHATAPKLAGPFKHQDTEINSADTPFEFSEESEEKIAFALSKCALPTRKRAPPPRLPRLPAGACGRYPDTLQGKQSAIMPMLWIVQQQLDKAHHITPTNVVKGAVEFPAQGSGGWVRPSLPWTLTRAVWPWAQPGL